MANISETQPPQWAAAVKQIEVGEPVGGGPAAPVNVQAKHLADRTGYLKKEIEDTQDRVGALEGKLGDAQASDFLRRDDNLASVASAATARSNLGAAASNHTHPVTSSLTDASETTCASARAVKTLNDIKADKSAIPATMTPVNNLASDSATSPLAAAQGKVLKGMIDTKADKSAIPTVPASINHLASDSATSPLAAAQGKALKRMVDASASAVSTLRPSVDRWLFVRAGGFGDSTYTLPPGGAWAYCVINPTREQSTFQSKRYGSAGFLPGGGTIDLPSNNGVSYLGFAWRIA